MNAAWFRMASLRAPGTWATATLHMSILGSEAVGSTEDYPPQRHPRGNLEAMLDLPTLGVPSALRPCRAAARRPRAAAGDIAARRRLEPGAAAAAQLPA